MAMGNGAVGKPEQVEKREHAFSVRARETAEITGVRDVVSFDEKLILLLTEQGTMSIEGQELRIGTLNTGDGIVKLSGHINGLNYFEESVPGEKKGFFGRLFR